MNSSVSGEAMQMTSLCSGAGHGVALVLEEYQ